MSDDDALGRRIAALTARLDHAGGRSAWTAGGARRILNRLLYPLVVETRDILSDLEWRVRMLERDGGSSGQDGADVPSRLIEPGLVPLQRVGRYVARAGPSAVPRLCVLFHPRCGSSWLINRLQHVEASHVEGEVFSLANRAQYTSHRAQDIMQPVWDRAQRKRAKLTGFKVAPYQILDKLDFLAALSSHGVHVLVLWRENLLGAVVSQARGKHRASVGMDPNLRAGEERLGPITIPRDEFLSSWFAIERDRKDLHLLRELLPVPSASLTYEEMTADPAAPSQVIGELLGRALEIPIKTDIAKLTPRALENAVANADDVRTWAAECGMDVVEGEA